jgi:hypothetical protein
LEEVPMPTRVLISLSRRFFSRFARRISGSIGIFPKESRRQHYSTEF